MVNGDRITFTNSAHIVLVEDDAAQRLLVAAYLEQAGFRVSQAEDLQGARVLLQAPGVDLLLLDLNLPDGDGLELARWARERGDFPIVVVSSRDGLEDRVAGLEQGADDYLCKPYHPRELLARIQSVLRRSNPDASGLTSLIQVGRFVLDPDRHTLGCSEGAPPRLTPGEMKLLCTLALARGRVLSRTQLLESISGREEATSDRSVDVLISRLRQKLETDAKAPSLLLTVPGIGYRLDV